MKTNKVIKEIEYMNLQAEIRDNYLYIFSGREQIASINLIRKFEINTDYWAFKNLLSEDEREKVYVLLTKLAETDPKDREEEESNEVIKLVRFYNKCGERRYRVVDLITGEVHDCNGYGFKTMKSAISAYSYIMH